MQSAITAKNKSDMLAKAKADLTAGKCVAIPTETVYGLAADATSGEAVARIFEMKGRPSFNPLICHVDGVEMAQSIAQFNDLASALTTAFWPGPLTLVLPLKSKASIHPLVCAGLDSVGIRWPKGISSQLIKAFGKPLAAPSANRSGRVSPTTAQHVREEFPASNLTIIDAGSCEVGLESTIAKVGDATIEVLRPGAITSDMIEKITGVTPSHFHGDDVIAPGMMKSHYAPNSLLELNCESCAEDTPWLQFGSVPQSSNETCLNLSPRGDLVEAAANLYGYLKELDKLGAPKICVSRIPMEGLGIAINDRLERASAPRDVT